MNASIQSTRVLLVDDQALFRGALAAVLDAEPDFTVVGEAADGHSGLDLALAVRPDLVLMDVEMPGMDGVSLARRVRAENWDAQIVFVTGYTDYILEGYEVEALNYLLKPVT